MNKKAEVFKAFLDERNIGVFQMMEVPNDELNTVVFRSNIAVEGQSLNTLVIFDNSIYNMIRVHVADIAIKPENETAIIKTINEFNSKFKVFRYFMLGNGTLVLDACIPSRAGEVDCELVFTIMDVIVKHLEAEYKNVMKAIWA